MTSDILDLDRERNRRLDPGTVITDAAGRELTQYLASYDLENGQRQIIGFWAYNRQDAADRIEKMKRSLKLEGVPADFDVADIEGR